MASAPQTLNHPTFGPCKLVPAIVAVRWRAPLDPQAARSALSANSLSLATQVSSAGGAPKTGRGASRAAHDPRVVSVNQSETLTFASATSGRRPTDAALGRLADDTNVQWVGPVYQANSGEAGPQSYFAINP